MTIWAVGILTWNAHAQCQATLDALTPALYGATDPILVLDHGSTVPFVSTDAVIVRAPENRGAGAGMSALVRAMLATGATHLLCLEDDWLLERPLELATLVPMLADPAIGQVRLGVRAERPSRAYWTYGLEGADAEAAAAQATTPLEPYPDGTYQRVRLLWSNNPFACTRATAERFLLHDVDEIRIARPYYASGLLTISTTPGHFRHVGAIRDRRGEPGWQK